MWIYFALMIWSALLLIRQKTQVKAKVFLAILPLAVLAAFRSSNIGNDTSEYLRLFDTISTMSLNQAINVLSSRWEVGYIVYNNMLSKISNDSQIILIVSSAFVFFVLFYFISTYSKDCFLSIFLFITMRYYFFFLSNVRQSIAMALIILAFMELEKKEFAKAALLTFLASLFHLSALVFFILILLVRFGLNRKFATIIILISFIVFVAWNKFSDVIEGLIPVRYESYLESSYYLDAGNISSILNFLVIASVVLVVFISGRNNGYSMDLIERNAMVLAVVLSLISIRFLSLAKLQYYYSMLLIVIYPNALNKINDIKIKRIVTVCTVVMFFAYHTIILILRPEWQHVYPYEFFWQYS